MWNLIKNKLSTFAVLLVIGLIMAGTKGLTKLLLAWFGYDQARKEGLSTTVGNYVGGTLLIIVLVAGLIIKVREALVEWRTKKAQPPPSSSAPPPPRPPLAELPPVPLKEQPQGRVPPRYDEVA